MNTPALADLQEMLDLLKANGYKSDAYEMHAPLVYARVLHTELSQRGVAVDFPCAGDEMHLDLASRGKITIVIH